MNGESVMEPNEVETEDKLAREKSVFETCSRQGRRNACVNLGCPCQKPGEEQGNCTCLQKENFKDISATGNEVSGEASAKSSEEKS